MRIILRSPVFCFVRVKLTPSMVIIGGIGQNIILNGRSAVLFLILLTNAAIAIKAESQMISTDENVTVEISEDFMQKIVAIRPIMTVAAHGERNLGCTCPRNSFIA